MLWCPPRAVLFDLDNTLFDRDASLHAFALGQHARISALHSIPRDDFVARFIELDERGQRWKDAVYERLVQEFAIRETSASELLLDYETRFCTHCVAFPGLHETLQVLARRFRLGLVTNGRGEFQERTIRALDLEPYFGAILISEREGVRKPQPEIFERAASQLQVLARECVFVGDDPQADIAGAQKAGMRAVWKASPFGSEPGQADAVIGHLGELPAILARWSSAEDGAAGA